MITNHCIFQNFEHIAEAGEEDLSLCPGFGPQKVCTKTKDII